MAVSWRSYLRCFSRTPVLALVHLPQWAIFAFCHIHGWQWYASRPLIIWRLPGWAKHCQLLFCHCETNYHNLPCSCSERGSLHLSVCSDEVWCSSWSMTRKCMERCSWIQAQTASGTVPTLQHCRQKSNSSAKPCSPALLDGDLLRMCSFKQESQSFANPLHMKCSLSTVQHVMPHWCATVHCVGGALNRNIC